LGSCGGDSSPTASTPTPTPVATSITLSVTSLSLASRADTTQLTATVTDANGETISGATVTWAATGGAATVSSTGLVTSVADGTATITATSGSASATASVTVAQVAANLVLSDSILTFASLSDTTQLTATVTDANGETISGATVTWAATGGAATVSSTGLVTSVADGTATITATSGSLSATASVTVAQAAANLVLSDSTLTFASLADTTQLTASVTDANGETISGATVTWATSNADVATVSSTGLVTSVADGTATITATSGSASTTATVTVSQVAAAVALAPTSLSFASVGDTATVVPTVTDALNATMPSPTVTWATSSSSVATVSSAGLVTAIADGTATITATSGSVDKTATATVSQVASSVGLSAASVSLTSPGDTAQLTATVRDANDNTIGGATVTWATSNSSFATVSSAGLVTSVGDGTATITATSGSASITASAVVTCSTDTDSDRLYDCVETNTGTYVSTSDTGTDPNDSDTDDDSIQDGDEVLGTLDGLDLPGLGVSPLIKTILVEYDWFDDSGHSHRPTAAMVDSVSAAFARQDPPIQLINDYGQGSAPFDGGNLISDADGDVDGFGSEFYAYKSANFDANRAGYFHYAMHPHSYNNGGSSGLAEVSGDDLINATLGWSDNYQKVAGTIMHELGHNLGLRHGGNETQNYKPNYNSVMNYQYQMSGVDTNCTIPGNGLLNYSPGTRPSLDENALDEALGICEDTAPVNALLGTDWNYDGDMDDTFVSDSTYGNIDMRWSDDGDSDDAWGGTACNDVGLWCNWTSSTNFDDDLTVLTDHNDWANLVYTGVSDSDGVAGLPVLIACYAPDDLGDIEILDDEDSPTIKRSSPIQIPARRPGN